MIVLTFAVPGKIVYVAHDGPSKPAFCFWPGTRILFSGMVGKTLPRDWATWNVLPSWSLTHHDEAAERRWKEVST